MTYETALDKKEWEDFLKKLFAPSPKGTEKIFWTLGNAYRYRVCVEGSMEILDNGTWRKVTPEESKEVLEHLGLDIL